MKNEKIITAWDKMKPGDEIKNQILNDITQKQTRKRKRLGFKRTLIIASVMFGVLILGAAAVAVVMYNDIVYYDFSGNVRDVDFPVYSGYEPGSEEYEFERELRNSLEEDETLFILSPDSLSMHPAIKKIYDYGELPGYLQNHGGEQFSLPDYLPKGFKFEHANIYLNLAGNTDPEGFEPVYTEEKFGNIYEVYKLPENQTRVGIVQANYYKGKTLLAFNISLNGFDTDNMIFSSRGEVLKRETLDIPQFKNSLLISEKYTSNSTPNWNFNSVKLLGEPVRSLNTMLISKTWHEMHPYTDHIESFEYYSVVYDINVSSSSVSRDEIIKIAESIK